jgi:hypothetical protein
LSIAIIKDGKIIRSNCTELFMDSNENDLKGKGWYSDVRRYLLTYYLVGEFC